MNIMKGFFRDALREPFFWMGIALLVYILWRDAHKH